MRPPPGLVARALTRLRLRGCDAVGTDAALEGTPWIANAGRLVLGRRVTIVSRPVQSHFVVVRGGTLEVGDDVTIGHGAALAAFKLIRIGSGAWIGPFASISDSDFHAASGRDDRPVTTPVTIGRGVRLETRVTLLRGSSVADGTTIAAGSVVSGHIPPGVLAAGNPARVVTSGRFGGEADPLDRVPTIVAETLGLVAPPSAWTLLNEIPPWDSLGALRVLLAIEESLGVTLDETGVARARTVSELTDLARAALSTG